MRTDKEDFLCKMLGKCVVTIVSLIELYRCHHMDGCEYTRTSPKHSIYTINSTNLTTIWMDFPVFVSEIPDLFPYF